MRKFIASLFVFFSLIGTFAPVTVSVFSENSQENQKVATESQETISLQLNTVNAQEGNDDIPADVDCGNLDFFCGIFKFFMTLFLFVPNTLSVLAGITSDLALKLSIDPEMYGADQGSVIAESVRTSWKILRDFSNIGFIFALFVAAFGLIVGKDLMGFTPKKTIVRVIIMALLVNFSLFFCRFIIQTADVLSHTLYNTISSPPVPEVKGGNSENFTMDRLLSGLGVKSISLQVIAKVNPQSILQGSTNDYDTGGLFTKKSWSFYVDYGIMTVVSFIIYLVLITIFVQMSIIFIGRIVGLWLAMIVSPLAFVSFAIPFLEQNKYFGFTNWLENFVKLAFVTPLYIFFIYLTVTVLNLNIIPSSLGANESVIANMLKMLIPLAMATFILMQGKKIATDMAGVIGEFATKVSGMVTTAATGLAGGAALGGAAFMGRQTVGRAGSAIANSKFLRDSEAKGSAMATFARFGGMKLGASSFDARNSERFTKTFSKATNALGAGDINIGKGSQGGYEKEGGIRENFRNTMNTFGGGVEKLRTKAYEELKLSDQAKEEKRIRADEDEFIKASEQRKNEAARQETAILEFNTSEAFMKSEDKRLDDEGAALEKISTQLEKTINSKSDDVKKLEDKLNSKDPNKVTQEELWELKRKQEDLENTKKEKELVDQAVLRKDSAKDTNREIVDALATKGFGSIADMKKEIGSLTAKKENSKEAEAVKKADDKYKEEKEKADNIAKEIKSAKNRGLKAGDSEYDDLITKQNDQNLKVQAEHAKLKIAKQNLDREYTDKIKDLTKLEKDFTTKYKDNGYHKALSELAKHREFTAAQVLEDSKFRRQYATDTTNQTYAKTLEARGRNGGAMRSTIGVITAGRAGGETIANSGVNVATRIRNNLGK